MPPIAPATPIALDYEHICDRTQLDCLDEEMLVETLSAGEDGPAPELTRRSLAGHGNLLIARVRHSEDPIAIFGFDVREVTGVPVLLGGSAFVRRDHVVSGIMRRLLAVAMLKTAGLSRTPQAVAARMASPGLADAMARFAGRLNGATAYPVQDGAPVPLRTAALVRAIAREVAPRVRFDLATSTLRGSLAITSTMVRQVHAGSFLGRSFTPRDEVLAVIDLRATDDEAIVDAARRAARAR